MAYDGHGLPLMAYDGHGLPLMAYDGHGLPLMAYDYDCRWWPMIASPTDGL
jgi:hypothetical protein